MIEINLLPWRDELRDENRKRFFTSLIMLMMAVIIFTIFVHIYFNAQIDNQNNRNHYIETQVELYQRQIQEIADLKKSRQDLIDRMNVIQQLQATRPFSVQLFAIIVQIIPQGLYLESITRTDTQLSIEGRAESDARIAQFMENISNSKILTNPVLIKIDSVDGQFSRDFSMNIDIVPQSGSDDENR